MTPVLTEDATRFVGAVTFSALASEPVQQSLWNESSPIPHTVLGQAADLIVVVPATAHTLARYAAGLSDDLLMATLLATRAPVIVCPAMHTEMWEHAVGAATTSPRWRGAVSGSCRPRAAGLAGGDSGEGRLAEPAVIVERSCDPRERLAADPDGARRSDLIGRQLVVSAGGTREPLDPVRFITNRSSGKQGHAIAAAAARRGRQRDARHVVVPGAAGRRRPLGDAASTWSPRPTWSRPWTGPPDGADVVVMAAAVADFRPKVSADAKLSKEDGVPEIVLEPTPDILTGLAARRRPGAGAGRVRGGDPRCARARGRRKLERKGVDLLVVNDVSAPGVGFDHDTNAVVDARRRREPSRKSR